MSEILFINGKVRFPITIDPTVWIFDDRKVDLTTYFDETRENTSELEAYLKNTSEHWDREIRYGAAFTRLRCLALPFINIEFMLIAVFQAIGGAKEALLLSFYRKGLIDLPLMVLANIIWPLYGLMLVQPFMECTGSIIALLLYRKERNQ